MTAYTLFSGNAHGLASSGNSTAYSFGVQFSVSQAENLTGIWWYSQSGAAGLPLACALYNADTGAQIAGTLNSSPSWSGAAGSGWVKCAYSGPALSSGINYVAVVCKDTSFIYPQVSAYWTSGGGASGITNGPLTAPGSASAVNGQATYVAGASIAFPTSTVSGYDFGVDVEVSDIAGAGGPPALLVPPSPFSPMSFTFQPPPPPQVTAVSDTDAGSGADSGSVAAALSDSDAGSGADTGSVAAALSGSDTGSAADAGSVAASLSDTDAGSGADTGSVAASLSDSDTGSGADSGSAVSQQAAPPMPPLIPPSPFSPMSFTLNAPTPPPPVAGAVSGSDTGSGADTGSVAAALSDSDSGSGADSGSVAAALSGSDTGSGAEAGFVSVTGSDAGSGADSGSVLASLSGSDSGSAADNGSVPGETIDISGSDTVSAADAGSVSVAPPLKPQGGWWQLKSILDEQKAEFDFWAEAPPMACPRDGEPLRNAPPVDSGSGVELFCKFCGWQYPRDWIRPFRSP